MYVHMYIVTYSITLSKYTYVHHAHVTYTYVCSCLLDCIHIYSLILHLKKILISLMLASYI